jgi:ribulose 1,5-bisphosphate synthetase/thiazole synthase
MANFNETRKKIEENIKNNDLRRSALVLTDAIERMSNIYSNSLPEGIKSFDVDELEDLIEHGKKAALREVV